MGLFDTNEKPQGVGTLRVGVVKHTFPDECAVQVNFPDVDDGEFVTIKLPVLQHCAGNGARAWWMPSVDDQVLVGFLSNSPDNGFVIGGFYAPVDEMPSDDVADVSITMSNGDSIVYDASEPSLTATVGKTHVRIIDGEVTVGNGSEKFVALAPDVKSQLDGIKAALDALQNTYNAHTHQVSTTGSSTAQTGLASATESTANHGYSVGDVASKVLKGE